MNSYLTEDPKPRIVLQRLDSPVVVLQPHGVKASRTLLFIDHTPFL